MKISRKFKDKNEKISPYCGTEELYHILEVDYHPSANEIKISKQINYLYGHGAEEIDEIYCYRYHAKYKTHDLDYLNKNEEDLISKMITEIYNTFGKRITYLENEIVKIKDDIEEEKEIKKKFSELIREQKLKRINGE